MYEKSYILKYSLLQTDKSENPDVVCQRRTLTLALHQISEIAALRTEQDKVEMRKRYGLKESKNPMLSVRVHADLYRLKDLTNLVVLLYAVFFLLSRSLPVEVLHTIVLGACK